MLAIGIVTITKAFELVLIIHESHSSMEVFLGPCFCLAIPLRIVSLFFFLRFLSKIETSSRWNTLYIKLHTLQNVVSFRFFL